MKSIFIIILFIAISAISALFFSQNDDLITINLLVSEISWPMNWLMVSLLVTGYFLGILTVIGTSLKLRVKMALIEKKLANKEQELSNIRSNAINDKY